MLRQEALVCTKLVKFTHIVHDFWNLQIFIPLCADVDDVKFVINYDFPGAVEDYIHRSMVMIRNIQPFVQ